MDGRLGCDHVGRGKGWDEWRVMARRRGLYKWDAAASETGRVRIRKHRTHSWIADRSCADQLSLQFLLTSPGAAARLRSSVRDGRPGLSRHSSSLTKTRPVHLAGAYLQQSATDASVTNGLDNNIITRPKLVGVA